MSWRSENNGFQRRASCENMVGESICDDGEDEDLAGDVGIVVCVCVRACHWDDVSGTV